jgi:hypothetical protein
MLMLRRARVTAVLDSDTAAEQRLAIELAEAPGDAAPSAGAPPSGAPREAIADLGLVGPSAVGDEVIVNVQALALGLGSGAGDIVHVNLSRGLDGGGTPGAHVMKLNYTSLQHAVVPVEGEPLALPLRRPVGVLALHGQLAPVAWAFARAQPGRRLGYVQSAGGALPGSRSRAVGRLRDDGLLAGHLTAGPAFGGGDGEAISTVGAVHHGFTELGWDAALCGPGPGIVGSASALGNGGLVALDNAHGALALGCDTLIAARMSSGDPRPRHRGMSHHTLTVLDLLLAPVTVALPQGIRSPTGRDLGSGLRAVFGGGAPAAPALDFDLGDARPARIARHDWRRAPVDLPGYAASGLPAETMGRPLAADPLFFASALAAGSVLGELVRVPGPEDGDRDRDEDDETLDVDGELS